MNTASVDVVFHHDIHFKPFRFSLACNGETHYFEEGIDWQDLEFSFEMHKDFQCRVMSAQMPAKFVNWRRYGFFPKDLIDTDAVRGAK